MQWLQNVKKTEKEYTKNQKKCTFFGTMLHNT